MDQRTQPSAARPFDIAIAGAGPAGLALARSLAGSGLSLALIDVQPEATLADPPDDGREIALTHRSMATLGELNVWDLIDAREVSDLREAQVMNGGRPFALTFEPGDGGRLGVLTPNQALRRALFHRVKDQPGVTLMAGRRIVKARIGDGPRRARLTLDDGSVVEARLLAAADSRFSTLRPQLGVAADIHPLGRSMIVGRVSHDRPHGHVATEWFDYGQTLALLPLNGEAGDGRLSSAVLTVPSGEAEDLMALSDDAYGVEIARRMQGRLGESRLAGARHLYPLAVTWSRRFAGEGFALVGDAAVGMHPVTAHGFNLGLKGQARLARAILRAHAAGRDIGATAVLSVYEAGHRRDALPLYLGTNALARLFTDERPPARLARKAALHVAQRLTPFKQAVRTLLTDPGTASSDAKGHDTAGA